MEINDSKPVKPNRRAFLGKLGNAAACAGAAAVGVSTLAGIPVVAVKTETAPAGGASAGASFPTKDYDWTKHKWGFGVDATKCIGCLRCVEACKTENDVPHNAHQFRTWVERYVTIEGDPEVHIDSQSDPVNIAASGSEKEFRFANRYKDAKSREGVLCAQVVQSVHQSVLCSGVPDRGHLPHQRRRGADRSHLLHWLPLLCSSLPLRRALLQ